MSKTTEKEDLQKGIDMVLEEEKKEEEDEKKNGN